MSSFRSLLSGRSGSSQGVELPLLESARSSEEGPGLAEKARKPLVGRRSLGSASYLLLVHLALAVAVAFAVLPLLRGRPLAPGLASTPQELAQLSIDT